MKVKYKELFSSFDYSAIFFFLKKIDVVNEIRYIV